MTRDEKKTNIENMAESVMSVKNPGAVHDVHGNVRLRGRQGSRQSGRASALQKGSRVKEERRCERCYS